MIPRSLSPAQLLRLVAAGLALAATACSGGKPVDEAAQSATVSAASAAATAADGQGSATGDSAEATNGGASPAIGRVDVSPTGNRVVEGRGSLDRATPIDIDLPAPAVWVVPVNDGTETLTWLAELADGTSVLVDETGATATGLTRPDHPIGAFDDPLPDARVVELGVFQAALVQPTDRYPHGVLGDAIEAASIQVINTETGETNTFGPDEPTVIEGIAPLLADLTGDGQPEILVTHANGDVGAWLALWSADGRLLARSEPIGLGRRWRNQLAVAPLGPAGEVEIVDVRTPHIGGTVQYFRLNGDGLELIENIAGFSTHVIGSRNLDMGVAADADGNGTLDIVVPSDSHDELPS